MTDMKTATSLVLVALGAILAFAITRSPAFLNLQVVGWVLMLTGGAGAVIPRRGSGWRRRSLVVKADDADEERDRPETQRFSRILMPGGPLSTRHPAMHPAGGQVERETIEEFIEE